MKKIRNIIGRKTLVLSGQICIFLAVVLICAAMFPRQAHNFKYFYEIGKPWGYELLTAEKDFPIYKTDATLQKEREQVLRNYAPYYNIDLTIAQTQIDKILHSHSTDSLTDEERTYLYSKLHTIYAKGIIDPADIEQLTKDQQTRITLVDERRVASTVLVRECYTPRAAYSAVVDLAPIAYQTDLKRLNLNNDLQPNIVFDTITSQQVRQSLLDGISLTEGMVQAGAKIIDRGEIVTEYTAQILNSLSIDYLTNGGNSKQSLLAEIGDIALLCLFLVMLVVYLCVFRREWITDFRTLLFFALLIIIMVGISCLTLQYTKFSIYLVPFAWVPIMVCVFYDSRTAFIMHLITVLIVSIIVPAPFDFLVIQITAGMVAVSTLKEMTQRAQLAHTAALLLLTYLCVYTAFTLAITGDPSVLHWQVYLCLLVNALLIIFAYGLIYLCEKSFGFVSSITLLELTNVNSRLMLDFAEKAPGTFQHSLQVSNLATEAARKIKANALLVRTGALYHDIGKMANPQYFTENQINHINPLKDMPYQEAAQIIISHVAEGIRIAQKHKLPSTIIRFIATHHGTSLTSYFYNSYANEHQGEDIDKTPFMYSGPRPTTKEGGILMMADSVEACSRSMQEYTSESISDMVEKIIGAQIANGQLSETPLSFKDVEDIKAVFKEKLTNMYHQRIAYPELKEQ